jgi:hypothetical protein
MEEVGVTRIDLVSSPRTAMEAVESVRRWARDRALSGTVTDRLSRTVLAAMSHGRRFSSRGVTIGLRWSDVDHVRVELLWRRCCERPVSEDSEAQAAALTLDAVADQWGCRTTDPVGHWAVVDAR